MKLFSYLVRSIVICALAVALSGCLGGITSSIDQAVAVIDKGINDIQTGSAEWQMVLQRVANDLPKDISEEIRTDAQNLVTRSIATAGTEFRCNIDFLKNRAIQNLQLLKAKLLKQNPPPLPPEFCQVSPDGIELATDPATWAQVGLYGYDLDYTDSTNNLFQVLLQNGQGQTTVLPESRIGRTTHYQVTLNLGNMAPDLYNNGIVKMLVSWNNSSVGFPQIVVVPWTPRQEPNLIVHPGVSPKFIPPHTGGDADFDTADGNPTTVRLRGEISVSDQQILGRVYMYAREHDSDYTTVDGWSNWQSLYAAPAGWKILSVRPTAASEVNAQLTGHETPDYGTPAGEVVQNFHVWGDRDGDEAGTYTGVEVTWQDLNITLEEVAPAWLH